MAGYIVPPAPLSQGNIEGKGDISPADTSLADTAVPHLTNFKCVTEDFMNNFGQKVFNTPQMSIFDSDTKTVDLRLKLIEEEVNELETAMKDKDMVETIDALGDILYVVYGAGGAFGVDLDQAFDLIHKSNMTKLCATEEEAKETVQWYKDNYTPDGQYPYDTPEYRLSPDGKYFVPFNASTGKILKSVNYSPVKFDSILPSKQTCRAPNEASTTTADLDTSVCDSVTPEATNFEKVTKEFMKNFGQKVFDTPQMDIFDASPKVVDLRLKLIKEETKELADAMKAKDMVETIDALGDILYVVYGAGGAFGVNLDQAFDLIHASNMTKLCKTEEEAKETVKWYKENYTPNGKYPYDTPEYRLSPDGKYFVPFNASTGKILKSVNYSPVKFDSILPAK
jgi:predicted HAD superfamily Cof-like phosphohydrolase